MTSPSGYVEPPQDLESLREHMREHHGFDAAHMLPLRVLLSLHEQDHADDPEPRWGGSPDMSRSPRFIARGR
jgi:hypothetical protein